VKGKYLWAGQNDENQNVLLSPNICPDIE